jgi:hypothetical protein
MKCVLRSVKLAKWLDKPTDELSDAELEEILSDLKAEDNRLSAFITNNSSEVEAVIIGLTGARKYFGSFAAISIEYRDFLTLNLELISNQGETALKKANDLHNDIVITAPDDIKRLALLLHSKGKKITRGKSIIEKTLKDPTTKAKLLPEYMEHEMHVKLDIVCTCETQG